MRSAWSQRGREPDLHFVANPEATLGDTTGPLADLLLALVEHDGDNPVLPIRPAASTAEPAVTT